MELNIPTLHRLARRAGVKRLSTSSQDLIRAKAARFLEETLADLTIYTEYVKRNTVLVRDIRYILRRKGLEVYGYL